MGIFSNKPWITVYSEPRTGNIGAKEIELLVKLDVRLKKKNLYEYKAYAVELVSGDHFKDITLDYLIKTDGERIKDIIREFNLR